MILVSVIYASCDQSSSVLRRFRVNQESNRFLSPNLFFGLVHNLVLYSKNVAFEHALHRICIWEVWVY
jgi:hypothetical protein